MPTQGERIEKRYGPPPVLELTDVQAAWLAALIDGEGSIGVWRAKRKTSGYRYDGIVQIANTNVELLMKAKEHTGELHALRFQNPGNVKTKKHKPLFVLRIRSRKVPVLLPQLLPYLIVKRRQAELVIAYYKAVYESPMGLPTEFSRDNEFFEHFYRETRALNKRGMD